MESNLRVTQLNTILNRAQHVKRESMLNPIGMNGPPLVSSDHSQKSDSKKSSIMDNDKIDNFSPKKSVFGEYPKHQNPFGHSDCEDISKSSPSLRNHKGSEHNYFEDKKGFEPNFFNQQVNTNPNLPNLHRTSIHMDRSKMKRFSIDFIEGGLHNFDDDLFNNITKFGTEFKTEAPPEKKNKSRNRKKRPGTSSAKNQSNLKDGETEKAGEDSEDKTQTPINLRRRYR
jgi:hypothetical protein